jgi:hypothetical protein
MAEWTTFYRKIGHRFYSGSYCYHADGDMVEVRTPDGRRKITPRGGSSMTSLQPAAR